MKKLICFISIIVITPIFSGCSINNKEEKFDIFRFHIRANSNSSMDQYIKYLIKDKVVALLDPILEDVQTMEDAVKFMHNSANIIEEYVNYLLCDQGCDYGVKVSVGENYFDKREIDGVTFESGIYESIIIELGEGLGNNWWGLIFPNFSYISDSEQTDEEIIYKSKIVEIYSTMIQK